MLSRSVKYTIASIVIAVLAFGIGVIIWPNAPLLQMYHNEEPRNGNYRAGGSGCEPATIALIKDRAERASQKNTCTDKAEEYRLQTNDLIQQTRAANAADSQTWLGYQNSWTAFFQTIGGFLTLIAAVGAAWSARAKSEQRESLRDSQGD